MAIHEAVYDELVLPSTRSYVQEQINATPPPPRLAIHRDSNLTKIEKKCSETLSRKKIYPLTKYDPLLDNRDDRGEVKSLAYIATKGLPYFAAHDSNAIQLVEKAEAWSTGLDNVQAVKMYELIYFLYLMNLSEKRSLRILYKYQYHLTKHEKKTNPEWGQFLVRMEALYQI